MSAGVVICLFEIVRPRQDFTFGIYDNSAYWNFLQAPSLLGLLERQSHKPNMIVHRFT
jgi:hypothetical protein